MNPGLRALWLVASVLLIGVAYPLSGWACRRYDLFTGEGAAGVALVLFALPLIAGGLTSFATWLPLGKWASLAIGFVVSAAAFTVAVIGCD